MAFLINLNQIATSLGNFLSAYRVIYDKYFPEYLLRSKSVSVMLPDKSVSKNGPLAEDNSYDYADNPTERIRMYDYALTMTPTLAILVPDVTVTRTPAMRTDVSILVDGFVEETAAAVQTDKTAEAKSGTANDLNLAPMTDTVGDIVYVGCQIPFWRIWWNIGIGGLGIWTNTVYYWNGAWVAAVSVEDETHNFNDSGINRMDHTPQGDWVTTTILGMDLYWLRIETTVFASRTVKPVGTQIFVSVDV